MAVGVDYGQGGGGGGGLYEMVVVVLGYIILL